MTVFFTADLHFDHQKMVEMRKFSSKEEMNSFIIDNWNSVVTRADVVYLLGDVSFGNRELTFKLLRKLKGSINLVRGNHDASYLNQYTFSSISDYRELKIEGQKIVMSHYPMLTWNRAFRGSFMLHGHCHGQLKTPETTRLDVGWDCFHKPISFEEIKEIMKDRKYVKVDSHSDDYQE